MGERTVLQRSGASESITTSNLARAIVVPRIREEETESQVFTREQFELALRKVSQRKPAK